MEISRKYYSRTITPKSTVDSTPQYFCKICLYRNRDWGNPYNPKLNTHIEDNWKNSTASPILHESEKITYVPKVITPPIPPHTSVQIPKDVPLLDMHAAGTQTGSIDRFQVWGG